MKKYRTIALSLATALCFAGLATYHCGAEETQPATGEIVAPVVNPIVQTNYGQVEGFVQDGVTRFYGIPYAKPPVGELRLQAPEEPEPWEGTRSCLQCGPIPIQPSLTLPDGSVMRQTGVDGRELPTSEDCLYLNIFAPPNAKNAPVYVWIHGGGWITGHGSKELYDGSTFANDGVILVTVNYRLGALGFLSDPEIADGASLGILDQIQALRWVHENISAFGGDPRSVTVGGESAGAFCVSSLIFSPLARGLFQQAILESGNILSSACIGGYLGPSLESVQARTQEIMRLAECETVADLHACPNEKLFEVASFDAEILRSIHTKNNVGIVGDGKVLPAKFQKALRDGKYNRVRLLYGFNRDEASLFVHDPTIEQYTSFVDHVFGDKAQEIKDHFPVDETNIRERSLELVKYSFFVSGMKMMADKLCHDGLPVYSYNFQFCPQSLADNPMGVAHIMELPYIFRHLPEKFRDDPQTVKVSQDMHNYWVNFIKNGTPNLKGMPTWMRYTPDGQNFMTFGDTPTLQPIPNFDDIAFIVDRMSEK